MTIKANVFTGFISQIYITLIGVALVPMYLKYMGGEAYGLVGFFLMLQAWFNLLDMGLSPTIARESARYHGGSLSDIEYRRIFRILALFFSVIAILGGSILCGASDLIAKQWLNVETLPLSEVSLVIKIMAVIVALRWIGGLYRGVILGAEKLVWLNGFTATMATLRFFGVLVSMSLWGYTPQIFFIHQLIVACFEVGILFFKSKQLLPSVSKLKQSIGWSYRVVGPLIKFSLTIAFTSSVWVFVTQTDKLLLSGILPLAEYGYFTLAVLIAGGIMVVSGPISNAIMPRMARIYAEGKHAELITLYRESTQWVVIVAGSAAVTLIICAEEFLFAWSGNSELSNSVAPIMKLYAIGNVFLSIAAFPYYLQYARGNLRYHLIGNVVIILFLIPGIIFASIRFGGIGAGFVWLGVNGLCLLTWVAYVHHKLEPGLHWVWLRDDVIKILLPISIIATCFNFIHIELSSRFMMTLYTLAIGVITLLIAILFSDFFKKLKLRI